MKSPAQYLSIIRGQPDPARFVISRVLRLVHLSHLVTMTVPPSVRLRLYPTSLSEIYFMQPDAREADHRFFEDYLASGMTVVDVGANIGALTIHASKKVGPAGRVISIEAHRRVFSYLLGNLRLNRCPNVEAINVAVGSSPGTVVFSDFKQDDINHVVTPAEQATPDPARYGKRLTDGTVVPVLTLDDIAPDASISLLKIDVEGYEREVLEGAPETLARTDCVFIESFEDSFTEYGYSTRVIIQNLAGHGFRVFRNAGDAWVPVKTDHVSATVENLVALRDPSFLTQQRP